MDDLEKEGINEEFMKFAIRESIENTDKSPWSNQTNSGESLTIMEAIEIGDVSLLLGLSGCVSAFTERDSRGWLPLHAAAVQPLEEILRLVLQVLRCTDLNMEERTGEGDTALTLAAEAGQVENVKILLDHKASPHNTNSRNESPLLLAVRQRSYEMVVSIILSGAFVEQVCRSKWTATHEAAKVGCPAILMLLIRHGAKVTVRDGHGVTPLAVAAEHGNTEVLDILIEHGGDVNARASNGDTVLYDAAGSGNLDCIKMLLLHGANPNVASYAFQLPIHRAAYEGHIQALRTLLSITKKKVIRLSGQSPVHSAADGGQVQCLELLIQRGFNVNEQLATHISENYGDLRRSALFFAVCNKDVTCSEILLAAGAKTDLDPLRCILVAVRAERYDLVHLLLSYGAEVNCYFRVISNTEFPTALQYCLRDDVMMRLLLNSGYQAYKCFQCCQSKSEYMEKEWTALHDEAYQIYGQPEAISFCEFVSVSWLAEVVGSVVRMLLDYVCHVHLCSNLRQILEKQPEWEDISDILSKPRSLQHMCRMVIRGHISLRMLNNPQAMAAVPFPPGLINYLTYREYDIYGKLSLS